MSVQINKKTIQKIKQKILPSNTENFSTIKSTEMSTLDPNNYIKPSNKNRSKIKTKSLLPFKLMSGNTTETNTGVNTRRHSKSIFQHEEKDIYNPIFQSHLNNANLLNTINGLVKEIEISRSHSRKTTVINRQKTLKGIKTPSLFGENSNYESSTQNLPNLKINTNKLNFQTIRRDSILISPVRSEIGSPRKSVKADSLTKKPKRKKNVYKTVTKNTLKFTTDLFKYQRIGEKNIFNPLTNKPRVNLNDKAELLNIKFQNEINSGITNQTNIPTLKTTGAVNKYLIRDFLIGEVTDTVGSSK